MADPTFLHSLHLAGFRAFLQPRTFDFSGKRSLAVFAPNGHGKSSLVDALEFMLSEDGTLERLGKRAVNNQAGPSALAHNGADEARVEATVTIHACSGRAVTSGSRAATGAKRPMPPVAAALNALFAVPPIIRGHALRTFVEGETPEARYTAVATWLRLGPLVEVQKNIRALRMQVKAAAADDADVRRVDANLARETVQALRSWDEIGVLAHVNAAVLAPLDPSLKFSALSNSDPCYVELAACARAEENRVGLAGLKRLRASAAALWREERDERTGRSIPAGVVPAFDAAAAALLAAQAHEERERQKAAASVFKGVWEAAAPLFADGATAPEACPVCATPISDTAAGSREGVRDHIAAHLRELADYAAAKKALDEAQMMAGRTRDHALSAVVSLLDMAADGERALADLLAAYRGELVGWRHGTPPTSGDVAGAVRALAATLDRSIEAIAARQGDHTYAKAKTKVDRFLELAEERDTALRTGDELGKLSESLSRQASHVSAEIRSKMQALLDGLRTPMNEIYRLMQGNDARPIRLDLPAEDDANQHRLLLLVDFAGNRPGVQPAGYLSDSQIHSVALALRLAAIKRFNAAAPIVAMDDVVTSYDADHRRTIAALIATLLKEHQVLITTHDERFFAYLKEHLEERTWQFTRIIGLDPSYGPRFADHKVSDEMIEARWREGQTAANEMRQAEEEWLLAVCRDFGVSVRIRPLERAYAYERSELASALGSFLKEVRLQPPQMPGVSNRFVATLIAGVVENFGSHFQDNPHGSASLGDEMARWEEFKTFRGHFACRKCGRKKFQRPPGMKKPVCSHDACQAQFRFEAVGSP